MNHRQNCSPIEQNGTNRFQFETQISQDNDKNTNQFAPWFRKKTYKQTDDLGEKSTHGFLQKLHLNSKLSKMDAKRQIKSKDQNRILGALKNNLKIKLSNEGVKNLKQQDIYSTRYKFIGNPNMIYRKKMLKFYHKPKSIQLSLQDNFQPHPLRTSQNLFSPQSPLTQRTKNRKQHSSHSSKKQRRSLSINLAQNPVKNSINILQTQKKFYQTLELTINKQSRSETRKKKINLNTHNLLKVTKSSNDDQKQTQERKKMSSRLSRLSRNEDGLSCQGKKILKNQFQSHRQKIRSRLLFRKHEDNQKIFLQ